MSLRVLLTADAVGGVWTYATDLAAGLAEHGVETTIAVLGPPPEPEQYRLASQIPHTTVIETGLPLDWLSDAAGTRRAAREVSGLAGRIGVDLIHLNSPALAGVGSWPMPIVGVAHGCVSAWWQAARPGERMDPALRWHRKMMRDGLAACARVIAPSAAFARTIQALYRLPALPRVVHNGRNWPALPQPSPPAPFVMTAGRLWDEVKNTPVLDAVAARVATRFEAAGPTTAPHGQAVDLRHLVAIGVLEQSALERRLAERPVFVSAATFEPFGLAVLEAAASGCALVLSDIPTFRELWDGAALFAPADDPAAFAARIDSLMHDPDDRLARGESARRRAARYSVARMADAMLGEYRAVLRAAGSGSAGVAA